MDALPIFPLNTVLFPGGLLPIKVFEQRYLEMTKICIRDGSPFGVCLIRDGAEVGSPALPAPVGCLATIREWDMQQLGVFQLLTEGGRRFRILRQEPTPAGLVQAEVTLLPQEQQPTLGERHRQCAQVLQLIIDKVGTEHFPAPLKFDDGAWVGYRLAEVLPITLPARQLLLELDSANELLERVLEVIRELGLTAPPA